MEVLLSMYVKKVSNCSIHEICKSSVPLTREINRIEALAAVRLRERERKREIKAPLAMHEVCE